MNWKPGESIFNLDALRDEFEEAEPQQAVHDAEVMEKWVYLGTVFSLMPSGKYYMPWACSNVEPCPTCGGLGSVENEIREVLPGPSADMLYGMAEKMEYKIRELAIRHYGMACEKQWPAELGVLLASCEDLRFKLLRKLTCPACDGIGSEEAYLDDAWREQAESELEELGAYLTGGEGDPCDLFAVLPAATGDGSNA